MFRLSFPTSPFFRVTSVFSFLLSFSQRIRKIYSLIPLRFVSSDLQTREEKIYLFVSGRYSFIFEEIYSGESREKEIVSDAGQHRGEAFSIISRHGKIVETREPWMRAYLAALLSIRYK